jgi:RNA polymerase sigma-70 factor (ECF subfamily)
MTAAGDAASSDEALARRAMRGDHSAFEALVGRYQHKAYRLAVRLTGDAADAEEAVQDALLRTYRRLGSFRGRSRFGTWFYQVATRSALMVRRARARRRAEPLDDFLPRFDRSGRHARDADYGRAAHAEELLDRRRLAREARAALGRLPDRYRAPFVLRDLEELPSAEVAAVLGISAALVRQRAHRARLMLRGYLSHLVGVEP